MTPDTSRIYTDREATTKNTKDTKNCNFKGNSSRGYALERQAVLNH
jgi:hypothetical protein